jgi:transposase
MEQTKRNTKVAGIDVSKRWLDVAVHGSDDFVRLENIRAGFDELAAWLSEREVRRVGLEASGGYERAVTAGLAGKGFEMVIHQPIEVRLFARMKRLRAKNDKIDARLIAAATAQVDAVKAANDPRLVELAERMTAYDQASDAVARLKVCREHVTLPDLLLQYDEQIRQLSFWKRQLADDLIARIMADPELNERYQLLRSIPGFGRLVAAAVAIRMPELGAMSRGQASALLGAAPFDHDSGKHHGRRFIWGGRARPRSLVYIAALAAKRVDPNLKAFVERLLAAGKPPKLAIVAVMRKLIEAANLVLARRSPWVKAQAS